MMSETTTYPAAQLLFELESFDGPLDLLLYLIKKEEVDIADIPIAEITQQYLNYLEACQELNLEVAGEFLFMASMLIRIKAQMLLPRQDENEELEDPRSELVNALLEYKKIKETSSFLENLASAQNKRYPRYDLSLRDIPAMEPELVKVDLTTLMIAFGDLLRCIPKETIYEIQPLEITVEMRRNHIMEMLENSDSFEFEDLFKDDFRKVVMVVTFIAMLELVKVGVLRMDQATGFSPIRLYKGVLSNVALLENS
jgi:segregation and condensation protein A